MLENLSNRITKIFDKIAGKKNISEDDLNEAMREIRIALLEADVALPVAKEFIENIKKEAIGKEIVKSISAGQMIVKIVHDELVKLLGSDKSHLIINNQPPTIILMVGLQGAGKTTSAAKLANRLKQKSNKTVLLASLDTYRPAAAKQLEILASKINVSFSKFNESISPVELAKSALKQANQEHFDILILDSAGRTAINEEMMNELVKICAATNPHEILLTADAMIGQDAVTVAKHFSEKLQLTGVILTRMDGDSRGGAALTMKAVTGCPIKFVGVGEKINELEEFNPDRIASRIIGMGDVVSLVEKAQEVMGQEEMEKVEKKMMSGRFDLNDLLSQVRNMKKMGGIANIINFLPGAGKLKEHLSQMGDIEKEVKTQEAIILSMTRKERANPDTLTSSRKFRVANGSGTNIQEVNKLLKKFKQMQKMMGKMGKIDKNSLKKMMEESDFFKGSPF